MGLKCMAYLRRIEHQNCVARHEKPPPIDRFDPALLGGVNPRPGPKRVHTFYLNSDDGSKLFLNDALIIDHDGDHSAIARTGQTILQAGKHKIRIEFFEQGGY